MAAAVFAESNRERRKHGLPASFYAEKIARTFPFQIDIRTDQSGALHSTVYLLDTQAKYLDCDCALEVDEVGFPTLVCGQVFYAY